MEPRWKKKISELLEVIPPLRGGDFQGMAGLSSDDSLLVGVNSARAKFYQGPRAVQHRLDEPGQIIPQHGCVPALPASVSPGNGNFSRKPRSLRAAQNQASVIAHTGAGSQATVLRFRSGEKYLLDIPLYRSGDVAQISTSFESVHIRANRTVSGVENRRSGGSLPVAFVRAAFAGRASVRFGMALFPVPAHRTGQARLAHPALGERFTVSPTESCVSE
jgi:hypothetical protein